MSDRTEYTFMVDSEAMATDVATASDGGEPTALVTETATAGSALLELSGVDGASETTASASAVHSKGGNREAASPAVAASATPTKNTVNESTMDANAEKSSVESVIETSAAEAAECNAGTTPSTEEPAASASAAPEKEGNQEAVSGASEVETSGAEALECNAGTTSSTKESTASGSAALGKDGNQEAVTGAIGVETSGAEAAERNAGTTSSTMEPTASESEDGNQEAVTTASEAILKKEAKRLANCDGLKEILPPSTTVSMWWPSANGPNEGEYDIVDPTKVTFYEEEKKDPKKVRADPSDLRMKRCIVSYEYGREREYFDTFYKEVSRTRSAASDKTWRSPVVASLKSTMAKRDADFRSAVGREDFLRYYKSSSIYKEYVLGHFESGNKDRHKYLTTFSELAMLKHDAKAFVAKHGILYKWSLRYEGDFNFDGEATSVKKQLGKLLEETSKAEADSDEQVNPFLPSKEWKWFLQIYAAENKKWYDWVYITRSDLAHGGLGLFAARDFPKNSYLGEYVGPALHTFDAWAVTPCDKDLKRDGHKVTNNSMIIRGGHDGKNRLISPDPVDEAKNTPLYLGMHYMNDASLTFTGQRKDDAVKHQNANIFEDGIVATLKRIRPNAEIFFGYTDESRKRKRTVVKNGRKRTSVKKTSRKKPKKKNT
jgi:hypothetical protein